MDGISDMLFVIRVENETELIYDFINRAAMDGTGLSQEVLGKKIGEVYPQETASFFYQHYTKVLTSRKPHTFEDSFVSPSGKRYYSETKLTPLFNEMNKCTQVVAVVKDITKEKWTEIEIEKAWYELNESKKRYQSLFDHNKDVILLFDLDGHITDGNAATQSVMGFHPKALLGSTMDSLVVKEDISLAKNIIMKAASGVTEDTNLAILNQTGQRIEIPLKVTPLLIDDEVIGIFGIVRDITETLTSLKKLEENEKRFRVIAEHANDLITLLDDKGEIIYASPSYKDILGFDHEEYVGKSFLHNVHPDDKSHLDEKFTSSIKNGDSFTIQLKQVNDKNEYVWCEANGTPVFDNKNKFIHMVVLTRNINIRKEYEAKLKHVANHDPLTDLPNRRLFMESLEQTLEDFQTSNNPFAVVMMDIDYFKKINDTLGHDVGDGVIEEFGRRVSRSIRTDDMVARLGGDEFALLLSDIDASSNAMSIAETIKVAMNKPWFINGKRLEVTTSMGIAMSVNDRTTTSFTILKSADIALYEAKKSGRDSYKIRELVD
ncbi:PAS domain S-box protein [Virgibacillus sp. DJP39]|uniref:PAS domain S-box protein n=1 Tax=Virgibacillus sp. DJP39 TaxID=3409790 RepID=UPI003BB7C4CD